MLYVKAQKQANILSTAKAVDVLGTSKGLLNARKYGNQNLTGVQVNRTCPGTNINYQVKSTSFAILIQFLKRPYTSVI